MNKYAAKKIGNLANGEAVYIRDGEFLIEKRHRYLVDPGRKEREEIERTLMNLEGKFWK